MGDEPLCAGARPTPRGFVQTGSPAPSPPARTRQCPAGRGSPVVARRGSLVSSSSGPATAPSRAGRALVMPTMRRVPLCGTGVAPVTGVECLVCRSHTFLFRKQKLVILTGPEGQSAPPLADDFTRDGELEESMTQAVVDFGEKPAHGSVDRGGRGDILNRFRPGVRGHVVAFRSAIRATAASQDNAGSRFSMARTSRASLLGTRTSSAASFASSCASSIASFIAPM